VFKTYLTLAFVVASPLLAGCKSDAASFFSGRPSEMSMVHNRIIAGPPEAMVELLRVPSRFADATESHITDWQESVIAWWWHAEKRELMITSLNKITSEELFALRFWVRVENKNRNEKRAQALHEIEMAIDAISLKPPP